MSQTVQEVTPTKARKRVSTPKLWKRNIAKQNRYSAKGLPEFPSCGHNSAAFQCSSLRMTDLKKFHDSFYAVKDKCKQDMILIKYCQSISVKRRRPKNSENRAKMYQIKCFIPTSVNTVLPVCQTAFLNILGIKKGRLHFVNKSFFNSGCSPCEKRGGDRKSNKNGEKRKAVVQFVKSLNCCESHYCRSRTARQYLPPDLSISKLIKIYNSQEINNLKVRPWLFRQVFNRHFNVGFKSPKTDQCSTCIELKERVKHAPEHEKPNFIAQRRVHILKAKAFYDYLGDENEETLILSFDCQKNQNLPKLPDQSSYYSRQLYMHNFTAVVGNSHSTLKPENVFSYIWTENLFRKDSNLVASAVFDRLQKVDLNNFKKVRLMSDGCGGQNKNTILLSMCMKWLNRAPTNIQQLEVIFPVVGHSYIPPDRVFARSEKEIRKMEVIVDPDQYKEVFAKVATVISVGEHCKVFDWKSCAKDVIKPTNNWHCKFSRCKRFILKRSNKVANTVVVKGEEHYKSDTSRFYNVCKKDKNITGINPEEIKAKALVSVNPLKLRDVNRLLGKHYGTDWLQNPKLKELTFYKNLLSPVDFNNIQDFEETQEENFCEMREEIQDLIV